MRVPLVCAAVALLCVVAAAPAQHQLQTRPTEVEQQPFVEEVVVESFLQVRTPTARQARTNDRDRTNLRTGARVQEANN